MVYFNQALYIALSILVLIALLTFCWSGPAWYEAVLAVGAAFATLDLIEDRLH